MRWLAYAYLRLRGWSFHGVIPDLPKMIVIGAPHTSNWDFVFFLGALHHFRIKVHYMGKHTLFRWPFGWFFRALGGIPVDRRRPGGIVGQVTSAMEAVDRMILVVAPEGTRGSVPQWKSGFLKIAEATGAPIVLAGIDGDRRRVVIGPALTYDGDRDRLMSQIRVFYADMTGFKPDLKGPVRLREEAEDVS